MSEDTGGFSLFVSGGRRSIQLSYARVARTEYPIPPFAQMNLDGAISPLKLGGCIIGSLTTHCGQNVWFRLIEKSRPVPAGDFQT
jgi:hypothetical protein